MANGVENPSRGTRVIRMPTRGRVPWTGNYGSRVWSGRLYRNGIAGPGRTMNETGGIRVRRDAGDWIRSRARTSALLVVALLSGLLGLVVGIGLGDVVGWRLVALPVMCLVAAAVLLARRYERGGFSRLLKGGGAGKKRWRLDRIRYYRLGMCGRALRKRDRQNRRHRPLGRDTQLPLGVGDEVPHGAQGAFSRSAATNPGQPGGRSTVGATGRRGSGVSGADYGKELPRKRL